MSDLEPKWRDKYYDAVAECEAIKKSHDENVKLLKEFQELFKEAEKEITELRKHCEAMATQINFAIQNDNTSFMLSRFQEVIKAYGKYKEGE